jgi:uncharacterized protein (DUF1778 family)
MPNSNEEDIVIVVLEVERDQFELINQACKKTGVRFSTFFVSSAVLSAKHFLETEGIKPLKVVVNDKN